MTRLSFVVVVALAPFLGGVVGCGSDRVSGDRPKDGAGADANGMGASAGGGGAAGASDPGGAGGRRAGDGDGTGAGTGAAVGTGGAGSTGSGGANIAVDPADLLCGNGAVDPGEECDDGNKNGRDACTAFCRTPRLTLGRDHSCALATDGAVLCWGRGDNGQLGDGTAYTMPPGVARPVHAPTLSVVTALSAGQINTCALVADGILCWGAGNHGQLGDGVVHAVDPDISASGPTILAGAKQVSAGGDHTCAVMGDATVKCWGFNLFGEVGNGATVDTPSPSTVVGLSDIIQVAAGGYQTCALSGSGVVSCWGSGGANLTTGTGINHLTPIVIQGLSDVVELSSGGSFTCALSRDGTVKCWGEGDLGQLGNGDPAAPDRIADANDTNDTPVPVSALTNVVQIAAGRLHVCALRTDHTVRCWGSGEFGQLGDGVFHNGFPTSVTAPVNATVFANVVEIATGGNHTCVVQRDRKVVCVGHGGYGQLGDGMFYGTRSPGSKDAVVAAQL